MPVLESIETGSHEVEPEIPDSNQTTNTNRRPIQEAKSKKKQKPEVTWVTKGNRKLDESVSRMTIESSTFDNDNIQPIRRKVNI